MTNPVELLEFAAEWAPYGGGDEEILPKFGLTLEEYSRRVLKVIETPIARTLSLRTRNVIRQQCLQRLGLQRARERMGVSVPGQFEGCAANKPVAGAAYNPRNPR